MRIGCLQFAPQVGDVNNNLNRADSVLSRSNPDDLDVLVLPELAFSGYNFRSLSDISPYLEPTCAGITSLWARTTALKYNCIVAAGYPEKVDVSRNWPASPEYYNSLIVVNEEGDTVANYRKTHLYYTDETWALEGPSHFYKGHFPGIGNTAMGICMDINPWRFQSPWDKFEFAFHVIDAAANVVILSMAWLTQEDARTFSRMPKEPDMETLTYWVKRLEPLIRAENEDEIIIIFANRTGVEDDAVYAGTSAVIGIKHGEVSVYGILGRGDKELLVVDTSLPAFAKLLYRPEDEDKTHVHAEESPTASNVAADHFKNPEQQSSNVSSESSHGSASPPTISEPPQETHKSVREGGRNIFGGHVFISQDALTPMTATFPHTPFEESPISPRYFWTPAEYTAAGQPHSPTSSTRSNTTDLSIQSSDVGAREQIIERTIDSAIIDEEDTFTPRNPDTARQSQLTELTEALKTTNPTKETNPARPSSPKSRNASRTGRGERSDSVLSRRPPSGFGNRAMSTRPGQERQPQNLGNISRNDSRSQHRPSDIETSLLASRSLSVDPTTRSKGDAEPGSSPDQRHRSLSPNLGNIDADMMIFEEGPRPRRDSLECHPDEDDFVRVHASQIHHSHPKSKPTDESTGRSGSRRKESISRGVGHERPDSRATRATTPAQDSPRTVESRAISRGRQRSTKVTSRQDLPRTTEYKSPRGVPNVPLPNMHRDLPYLPLSPPAGNNSPRGLNSKTPLDSPQRRAHRSPGFKSPERPGQADLSGLVSPFSAAKQSEGLAGKVFNHAPAHTKPVKRKQSNKALQNIVVDAPRAAKKYVRESSMDSFDGSDSMYSSTVITVETMGSLTPEKDPKTPQGHGPSTWLGQGSRAHSRVVSSESRGDCEQLHQTCRCSRY
ncbi:amino-terminal amidase [Apiospora sp. TS-2023a]